MGQTGDGVPLTVLAARYARIKAEVSAERQARRRARRHGGRHGANGDDDEKGRLDVRGDAAARLGAGVSHGTLEKVLWLQRVAGDRRRGLRVKLAAYRALEAIAAGEPVDCLHEQVCGLVSAESSARAAQENGEGTGSGTPEGRPLERLRRWEERGAAPAGPARRDEAAFAAARRRRRIMDRFDREFPA